MRRWVSLSCFKINKYISKIYFVNAQNPKCHLLDTFHKIKGIKNEERKSILIHEYLTIFNNLILTR